MHGAVLIFIMTDTMNTYRSSVYHKGATDKREANGYCIRYTVMHYDDLIQSILCPGRHGFPCVAAELDCRLQTGKLAALAGAATEQRRRAATDRTRNVCCHGLHSYLAPNYCTSAASAATLQCMRTVAPCRPLTLSRRRCQSSVSSGDPRGGGADPQTDTALCLDVSDGHT